MKKDNEVESPNRRELLIMSGKGAMCLAAASALGQFSASARAGYALTPIVEEGPFCLDSLANNLLRSDVRKSSVTGTTANGYPLVLTITVSKLNSDGSISPLNGAYVDIWHCDPSGNYSGETNFGVADLTAEDYLRGYQISNARGSVKFISIYPGWYSGRTTHVHVRIRTFSGTTAVYDQTTQLFFDETVTNQIYTTVSQYIAKGLNPIQNSTDTVYTSASEQSAVDSIYSLAGSNTMLRLANNGSYINASVNLVIAASEGVAALSCPAVASSTSIGGGLTGAPPTGTPPTVF